MSQFNSEFTLHGYELGLREVNKPIRIHFIGDIHWDANCDREKFNKDLARWKKDKDAYFFLMGDYLDYMSTTERKIYRSGGFHDTTSRALKQTAVDSTNAFLKEIEFMKGRIIGMIEGNHHFYMNSGITTTQYMCEQMGCKYLGISSIVELGLSIKSKNKRAVVSIYAHHGLGGGSHTASLTRVMRMRDVVEADIFAMGDNHDRFVKAGERFRVSRGNGKVLLKPRQMLFVRTGSYQMGYVDGQSNYPSGGCMEPRNFGNATVIITPRRDQRSVNGKRYEQSYVELNGEV